jgi:hypothetical protein
MITKTLSKDTIDTIFEMANEQGEYWLRLYNYAIPNWSTVFFINGYPKVNPETAEYIFGKAIEYDKVHHPDVLSGGLWLDYGFGVGENIEPWTVQYDEDDVYYGTELELQEA